MYIHSEPANNTFPYSVVTEEMEVNEIMNKLFQSDLDEIIQKIFLNMDPMSLKSCTLACKEWNQFIQQRLWKSKSARKILFNRLIHQWKYCEPLRTDYTYKADDVNYLVADDEIIVCGYSRRGVARVFDIHTGDLIYELQCKESLRGNELFVGVQLDLGTNLIASVTHSGVVSIWNKVDGKKLYQAKHHGEHIPVFGLKVCSNTTCVISGGGDGSLVIVEPILGVWRISCEIFDNRDAITHIDADGKWAVAGSRRSIKLWDLEKRSQVDSVKPLPVKVWMLAFKYPNVYVVGGEDWNGIQIWNITNGSLLRHIEETAKAYHNVHIKNRFLTTCEHNETWRQESEKPLSVVLFDVNQLTDSSYKSTSLWRRNWNYYWDDLFYRGQVNAVTNSTSLIVAHDSVVTLLNFWKDRVTESKSFVSEKDGESQTDMDGTAYFDDMEDKDWDS